MIEYEGSKLQEVIPMKKDIRLYNVLFPLWMLMLFPQMWLIVLPGNFLVDSAVLLLAMAAMKITERKMVYKQHILKVFCFGLLADVIGSGLMFLVLILDLYQTGNEWYLAIPAVILSGVCIFLFNYFVTFKKMEKAIRMKLALTFAVVTAPYTFMVPTTWLY